MTILSTTQIETFQRDGYLLLEDAIAQKNPRSGESHRR